MRTALGGGGSTDTQLQNTEIYCDTNTDSNADTNMDTNTDSNADTNMDTNTDTNMKAQLTPSFKMLKQNSFEYLAIQIQI